MIKWEQNLKQQSMHIGIDGDAIKILPSEFLLVVEIMIKHCWSHFYWIDVPDR